MDKKLITKVQKINPKVVKGNSEIANALVIEADDELTLEKKGTLYVVYDVISKTEVDFELVEKMVADVLHDTYFQAESASPVQSIEKAILKLRDHLTATGIEETNNDFNIGAAVLWGNTLYLVQYGTTKIFLLRENDIKPVNAATEGKFAVASGVVKDNDVIIVTTDSFTQKYPPKQLLESANISGEALSSQDAAIMIKFNLIREFTKDENVSIYGALDADKPVAAPSEKKPEIPLRKHNKPKMNIFATFGNLAEKLKKRGVSKQPKDQAAIATISSATIPVKKEAFTKKHRTIIIGLIGILAATAIAYILLTRNTSDANTNMQTNTQDQPITTDQVQQAVDTIANTANDAANEVTRVEPTVFYDIKVTDETAEPSHLILLSRSLVAVDPKNNTIYSSEIEIPKFERIGSAALSGIKDVFVYEDSIGIVDNTGLHVISEVDGSVIDEYENTQTYTFGQTATYLDFLYTLDESTIVKLTPQGETLVPTTWAESAAFNGAVDLRINFSIYIAQTDDILKYTSGTKDTLEITVPDTPLGNVVSLITNPELENIYVADAKNNRIVIFNEDFDFVKQLRPTRTDTWTSIRSITVSDDEATLYILDGSRVYTVSLIDE